jgi:hypothetical protein
MKPFSILAVLLFVFACESKKGPSKEEFAENLENVETNKVDISDDNIRNIINSIPSPLEISFIIQDAGILYDKTMLNESSNVSKYSTNDKKALNLGVYGTDLGYTDIYGQNQDGIEYLSAIKDLSEDLGIGQYFDFALIRSLTESKNNLDSLLLVTSDNFNRINDHFQEQNRANLSVMLLLGGWIESLHLTCNVASSPSGSQDLKDRVGEQKIILENMMILMDFYVKNDGSMKEMKEEIASLKEAYSKVEIVYTYEESTSEIVDGVLIIKDNSSSSIVIDDATVAEIAAVVERIRNKIVG